MNPPDNPVATEPSSSDGAAPATMPPGGRRTTMALIVLFGVALLLHFRLATLDWNSGFLWGHEFRQTHTAIITFYLDKENRFSLHYTTPLFGKPWSVPLEFPLYEWSVVGVSRALHLPHFEAARTVSLTCFYLALPGLYLLLGSLGLAGPRRLVALTLALACPVYIFYSRTFLMESMVLMFSVWFLAAFVRTMRERRLGWLALCAVAGAGAGLIKSTTFFVWLFPAALYGAWCLGSHLRPWSGWKPVARTLAWGLGAAVVPCAATYWWVKYTDAIKIHHPSAHIFTSRELTEGSFGLYSLGARFAPAIWQKMLINWQQAIMSPWLLIALVVIGAVGCRRYRGRILGAAGLFLFPLVLFPAAYADQDYYFYACTFFLIVALGYVLLGVLESGLPPWLRWLIVAVPLAAMLMSYRAYYYRGQIIWSNGGWGFTEALKVLTPPESVIIVSGADWAPIVPYYAQRKALMIRSGLQYDYPYLDRAFSDLDDENVSALVLINDERKDRALIQRAVNHFNLDPSPTFSCPFADIYVNLFYRDNVITALTKSNNFNQVTLNAKPGEPAEGVNPFRSLTPGIAAPMFPMVSPLPMRFRFRFGYSCYQVDGATVLSIHPDSDLWVPAPPGATRIHWEYGILAGAYERTNGVTDGVEFIVEGEAPDGSRRLIFHRLLDPAKMAGDRGMQRLDLTYRGRPGETLVFQTRPNGGYSFDWAYMRRIEVQ
jgi:hypothetical protein